MVCEMKQLILHDDNYYTPTHGLILHMMQFRKYFREEKVLFILFLSLSLSLSVQGIHWCRGQSLPLDDME